jgi:hypothetical protein
MMLCVMRRIGFFRPLIAGLAVLPASGAREGCQEGRETGSPGAGAIRAVLQCARCPAMVWRGLRVALEKRKAYLHLRAGRDRRHAAPGCVRGAGESRLVNLTSRPFAIQDAQVDSPASARGGKSSPVGITMTGSRPSPGMKMRAIAGLGVAPLGDAEAHKPPVFLKSWSRGKHRLARLANRGCPQSGNASIHIRNNRAQRDAGASG